jgi:hypothetical protein
MGFGLSQICLFLIPLFVFSSSQYLVFAQAEPNYEFTKIEGDNIANNPVAQQILQKIEESKRILADLQAGIVRTEISEYQKFVEEQRKIAKEKLERDLAIMYKEYEPYTPRNAYSSFLSGVNSTHHGIFWDQFDYMDNKVQIAKAVKEEVLARGGTSYEAHQAFTSTLSFTRVEMIKLNQELNIKYGFTDEELQSYFDENGKLPRYENDTTPCFSCDRYQLIVDKIISDSLKSINGTRV